MLKFRRLGFGVSSLLFSSTAHSPLTYQAIQRNIWRFSTIKPEQPKEEAKPKINNEEKPQQKETEKPGQSVESTNTAKLPEDTQNLKIQIGQEEKQKINKMNEQDKKNKNAKGFARLLMVQNEADLNRQLVAFKKGIKDQRTVKQYRDAILFEDILKNQVRILVYDTKGKHLVKEYMHILIMFLILGGFWALYTYAKKNPQKKVYFERTTEGRVIAALQALGTVVVVYLLLKRYLNLCKHHVENIIYDTQTQKFELGKRRLWGSRYTEIVSRDNLVYSESPFLWKKGINYFDMQTKKLYEITQRQAWLREDLFSHLISQRINTELK